MAKFSKTLVLAALVGVIASSCGKSPFGPGAAGGLNLFAKIGKALQRPSAVNDEGQSKEQAKTTVSDGLEQAKRLAKGMAGAADKPAWLDSNGIESVDISNYIYKYYEVVTDKPSDDDPDKKVTGRGEVVFKYNGIIYNMLVVPWNITDVYSWHFIGRERKTWKSEICSVDVTVTFASTDIHDIKPGETWAWGKNISETIEAGKGDTASFRLDSLDDVNHIQFGEGHFYDAHTGKDNTGEPNSFDFALQVKHINTQDPSKPYLRYEDNQGTMNFLLPWGSSTSDSLYFTLNFYPQYERDGDIRKNGPDGKVLVEFKHNEKTGEGWVKYYNDDGELIETETEPAS